MTVAAGSPRAGNVLELRGVRKEFGGVPVLHGVDLVGRPGEVVAVVGANGAGKSTLIKILAGALPMSGGEMWLDGARVEPRSPHDAHDLGIRTVYQELTLVPELTVTENLLLGNFPRRRTGLIDWPAAHAKAGRLLAEIGFGAVHPRAIAGRLTVARQQMVEIAKALVSEPRVLVLDEPSAVLAGTDLDSLFGLIRRLRDRGVLVIYVSHRLAEVLDLATSIVVIKDGRVVTTTEPARTSEDELIRLMAGRRLERIYPARRTGFGEPRLRVTGLSRPGEFTDVSFTVRAGEIVGMFGLVGSGRSELARCVFGAEPASTGEVRVGTESGSDTEQSGRTGATTFRSPTQAITAGLALVTEDRKRTGLVPELTVRDNIGLTTLYSTTRAGLLDVPRHRRAVDDLIARLDIRPAHCATMPVVRLSGGNQQKAVLAKWLLAGPRVLILDEPTRGVDMATRMSIYQMVDDLARDGLAVLLISSDLTEVLGATDRVLVMREGRITADLDAEHTTEDEVLGYSIGRAG
ncbi:sugar ABC transporter ATP-binding protein [Plantactinospora endophytica]|uniref:Ribose import ATP-binding protein RbsA 2 n=1 Tax=Plantactinospora endophytica TaxID=673535 RepID=A0ABQ4ED61_9ACTN|nr:sugar ABC transporter ATP-binding protein [Plantactinospora endophytica]GIG92647.1 ribose import ATP-binding protein RbsA 2 [Plantactinospora endophytica]